MPRHSTNIRLERVYIKGFKGCKGEFYTWFTPFGVGNYDGEESNVWIIDSIEIEYMEWYVF